jgi:hypothetical protein
MSTRQSTIVSRLSSEHYIARAKIERAQFMKASPKLALVPAAILALLCGIAIVPLVWPNSSRPQKLEVATTHAKPLSAVHESKNSVAPDMAQESTRFRRQ